METKKISQNELIRRHLEAGKTITAMKALHLYGCLRLGARIYDLTQKGMTIYSRIKKCRTGKWVAEYSAYPFK
jgi:hypothetical protein